MFGFTCGSSSNRVTSARALFSAMLEVVDAEEQEKPVARRRRVRAHQGWMLVRAPLVEAEQDGSIRIQDLTEVVMGRSASRAGQRATGTI